MRGNSLTREGHGHEKRNQSGPHVRIIAIFGRRREIFELTKSSTANIIEHHGDANNDCQHIRGLILEDLKLAARWFIMKIQLAFLLFCLQGPHQDNSRSPASASPAADDCA